MECPGVDPFVSLRQSDWEGLSELIGTGYAVTPKQGGQAMSFIFSIPTQKAPVLRTGVKV